MILGGSLIILFSRIFKKKDELENSLHGAVSGKIPTIFALGINMGVAPLLFLQVIYGHLFYSSSVLLAIYWILIIPLLIIAYYGAYIHYKKYNIAPVLSKISIGITAIIVLYISFIFVNNMTLMMQPEKWTSYFNNRDGFILNWGDPILFPRYLHFVIASIAVSGLFMSIVWRLRSKNVDESALKKSKKGLKLFAYATIVQVLVGSWYLLAIPREFMLQFMGRDLPATIAFTLGFLGAIVSIVSAFRNYLKFTAVVFLITMVSMIFMRMFLRFMFLNDVVKLDHLEINAQYDVLVIFFVVLAIGVGAVVYILKTGFNTNERRASL
jgi:MFS family permease